MPLNLTIDGPVGAGKSSIADAVAKKLGILHLDTGAMYRTMGLAVIRAGINLEDEASVTDLCGKVDIGVCYSEGGQHTLLDGEDVSGLIRTEEISMAASCVAKYPGVREKMVELQRHLASQTAMLVDGRDIGTRVLPDAPVKIYLTASAEERARRRFAELRQKGALDTYAQVLEDLRRRDEQDMNRAVDPLRPASDAVTVDSTTMDFEQVVARIIAITKEKTA